MVILGTKALEAFVMALSTREIGVEATAVDRSEKQAVVKERMFLPSGSAKTVALVAAVVRGDHLLCASVGGGWYTQCNRRWDRESYSMQ